MEFLCEKKYILLPASFHAQKKRLYFHDGDKLVLDLVVALDNDAPEYRFPVDVARFRGKTLRVSCDPAMEVRFDTADEVALDYAGKYRPLVHFTSKRGWLNDPNGLTYAGGKYLMYYQHNPAATTWENMHWGFAESNDLIHWREYGDVLFPDERGTIFSGSAIVDRRNVTGLRQGDTDVIVYFFTCAGDTSEASRNQPFTQHLAYSTDGGRTLIRRQEPLLGQLAGGNRDPKVIPYQPDGSYIMALYLEGHEFALFKSMNLLDWTELQRLALPDDAECPDFYPLPTPDGDGVKWVFSAASDRYVIGHFDGQRFTAETEQRQLNYGNASYAAQSWSDTPDGRRIRTAFISTVIPGMPFGCCMDIPQEMSLRRVNGQLRLCAIPVTEISSLYSSSRTLGLTRVDAAHPLTQMVDRKACDVTLRVKAGASFRVALFGLCIEYDASARQLRCGEKAAPVTGENGTVALRILYDTLSAEIFADSGSVFLGMTYIQDANLSTLTITSEAAEVESLTVAEMKPFYESHTNQ